MGRMYRVMEIMEPKYVHVLGRKNVCNSVGYFVNELIKPENTEGNYQFQGRREVSSSFFVDLLIKT